MFWLGPERDSSIYRGLDAMIAPLEAADYIVCTGLFDDETESAEDYRAMLLQARERKLTLVCANPDIVVERGDRLIYCAGAIAELYRELGGEVIFYGKPHRPIYERAMALAAERRGQPADRSTGCWRSAIPSARIWPARTVSASTACSSPAASTPKNSRASTSSTRPR